MRVLVTGATGYVGGALLEPLGRAGHEVTALVRDPSALAAAVPFVQGDVLTGAGLDEALGGADVAYYLIHSMEAEAGAAFADRELAGARRFAGAARRAGLRRLVYLGGPVPAARRPSPHLASRLAVEEVLREAAQEVLSLRASIVIGARSRSFRLLVRLVERLPAIPLPPWREHRTAPVDERDLVAMLVAAAVTPPPGRQTRPYAGSPGPTGAVALDAAGPDVLTYGEIVGRIAEHMLVGRPTVAVGDAGAAGRRLAAALAGEDRVLVDALMGSLEADLVPHGPSAADELGVPLHSFDAAVEHALRDWERIEPLAAR